MYYFFNAYETYASTADDDVLSMWAAAERPLVDWREFSAPLDDSITKHDVNAVTL